MGASRRRRLMKRSPKRTRHGAADQELRKGCRSCRSTATCNLAPASVPVPRRPGHARTRSLRPGQAAGAGPGHSARAPKFLVVLVVARRRRRPRPGSPAGDRAASATGRTAARPCLEARGATQRPGGHAPGQTGPGARSGLWYRADPAWPSDRAATGMMMMVPGPTSHVVLSDRDCRGAGPPGRAGRPGTFGHCYTFGHCSMCYIAGSYIAPAICMCYIA